MTGSIRCAKCFKAIGKKEYVCSKCGYTKMYIDLYWQRKHWRYWKDIYGFPFNYESADRQLTTIRAEIDKYKRGKMKLFDPANYIQSKIDALKFEMKIQEWLEHKKEEVSCNELAPSTYSVYQCYTKNYYPFFHDMDVREITFQELDAFKDTLPKHLKIKMKKNILNGLHAFMSWLRRKQFIKEIPLFPIIKGK